MSRILITGMSAPQYSEALNRKTLGFAGAIKIALEQAGHTVTQKEPDTRWVLRDFTQYDVILVGLSPLVSISSNGVYGTLHTIKLMQNSGKIIYFVDAPEPSKI